MTTTRRTLPNRRPLELQDIVFNGRPYVVGIGRFHDGAPAEVFIDQDKPSCDDICHVSRDAAVTLSIALQFGTPISAVRSAVTRNPDGSPASLIGMVVDMLAGGAE
jgi:hypothetical protein